MQNLLSLWSALTLQRRIVVIGATVAMFLAVLTLGRMGAQPNLTLLYAGLDNAAAGEVIAALDQQSAVYEVRGNAIYVTEAMRDSLRMTLAAQGLPAARPGVLPLAGIALGALAVWLVSGDASHGSGEHTSDGRSPLRSLGLAVLSGALIGGFLVLLSHVQPGSSGWPLVAGRASATVCLWTLVLIGRAPVVLTRPAIAPMLGAAVTDVAGNVLYLLAVQRAPLSLTATLVSLAPATTVLLAQVVLREQLSARQRVGIALALVAVFLLSRGH